jgi:peroxiredoxin
MGNLLEIRIVLPLIALACLASCCYKAPQAPRSSVAVDELAAKTHSVAVGQTVPPVTLRTIQGQPFDLRKAVAGQPTVVIFYRGGWCPYCNRHLVQLQELEPKLKELGYQILAISPDRPEELAKSIKKQKLKYTLLSDSDMTAAKAFGLAFRVDDALVNLYKTKYNIDLEAASGRTHHELPVPAVYIVGRSGKIRYEYVNPNYKIRIKPEKLLQAARSALPR